MLTHDPNPALAVSNSSNLEKEEKYLFQAFGIQTRVALAILAHWCGFLK
jgi:hypothetical protein